jgi:hypothetical protein
MTYTVSLALEGELATKLSDGGRYLQMDLGIWGQTPRVVSDPNSDPNSDQPTATPNDASPASP